VFQHLYRAGVPASKKTDYGQVVAAMTDVSEQFSRDVVAAVRELLP
jgi:hypothetical protein